MDYLTIENGDFVEVIRQVNGITNSGTLVRKIFDFIKEHDQILTAEEYYREMIVPPRMPPVTIGMLMSFQSKYSINIKRITIILLAILLDTKLSLPLASGILGITGYSMQAITKIKDEERCLIIDILLGNKRKYSDFDYYKRECIENDINCPFRKETICERNMKNIEEYIKLLQKEDIVKLKNGMYVQCL